MNCLQPGDTGGKRIRGRKRILEKEKVKTEKATTPWFTAATNWIKKLHLTNRAFAFIVFIVFAADQLSKLWVLQKFSPGETWPLIPEIFHLTYVRNPGAAFGLFANKTPFFIAISLLVIFLIIFGGSLLETRYFLLRLALALQLGGALGNFSDRLRTGYVIDFLDFRFWPVFNLADMALVLGIVLLLGSFSSPNFSPLAREK
jgi:signal peptidase II